MSAVLEHQQSGTAAAQSSVDTGPDWTIMCGIFTAREGRGEPIEVTAASVVGRNRFYGPLRSLFKRHGVERDPQEQRALVASLLQEYYAATG